MEKVIFDFEVFKNDTLLGAIILDDDENKKIFQSWDYDEIRDFFLDHRESLWVGHNNQGYDNFILESIMNGSNPYQRSVRLITKSDPYLKCNLDFYNIDLMKIGSRNGFFSLKMTEGALGKNISETEVDFNLDRPLTDEEKKLTEGYNRNDLEQTFYNYLELKDKIQIRLDLCAEFGLSLSHLSDTEGKLGATVLGAHKIYGIENMKEQPKELDDLRLDNKEVLDFYWNQEYLKDRHFIVNTCGDTITGGSGGLHSALKKTYVEKALYFDISGFYNLTMINKGLLPRTLDEEGRARYIHCYKEQLRLKKTNPQMRKVYKTILLAVFGSMLNKYTDFYDPDRGNLVMIVGQLYMIDLLEKLNGKVNLVQTNTDGIIVEPLDWEKRNEVISIVEEWENRTGYVVKKEEIHDIWQKDVNNYIYRTKDDEIVVVGSFGSYEHWNKIFDRNIWQCKELPIVSQCVVDFLMKGKYPEQTIDENRENLRMFQFICKKGSYDYLEYDEVKDFGGSIETRLQNVNRAFALKDKVSGMIYKVKGNKKVKVGGLPDNVFVYNNDITSMSADLLSKIDYDWYVRKAYEKINSFLPDDLCLKSL